MANTTNFGWETPDDTDLVKDGAAAMRTLGNSIDASFVDLKGGTTGQILAKATNTDLDFTWSAAGIAATIVDAKGDLIAATAADTVSRLAVGANGTVLTADSAEATGLKWATPAAPSFVGCMLFMGASVTLANNTFTAMTFAETDYLDTDNFHNPATNNSRITIPTGKGGKYLVFGQIVNDQGAGPSRIRINLNGSVFVENRNAMGNEDFTNFITSIITLAAGDYVELIGYQLTGGNNDAWGTTATGVRSTAFGVQYLGA